ncbi:Fe3+ hydroxamate ABC transporter substrate-binding protein [Bacillus sp. SD075]|nr:Fe3+ hydroxamate ABC transporter substrate-binding protein [Bacillus sp. SD075]
MFREDPKCGNCGKEIKGDEVALVKMLYPQRKGMTEIKAY